MTQMSYRGARDPRALCLGLLGSRQRTPGLGIAFLPLVLLGTAGAAGARWAVDKWAEKISEDELRAQLEREGKGTIAMKPPPAPPAPRTEAEMRGQWTPERMQEESARAWRTFVLEAPSGVSRKPWEPGELGPKSGDDWTGIALWAAAGIALAAVAGLVIRR